MKKILFIGLLFVLAGTGVWSQEVSDSVRIHYRRGYRGVDPDYHNKRVSKKAQYPLVESDI